MYRLNKIIRISPKIQVISSFLMITFFFLTIVPLFNINRALKSFKESVFIESGYVSNVNFNNTYYSNIQVLNVFDENLDKRVDSNILMVDDNIDYYGNYFTKFNGVEISNSKLSQGEVSISKSFSKRGFYIGDTIVIKINTNIYLNYKVKYIFDDFYGFNYTNFLKPENLIIIGFSNEVIENAFTYKYYRFSENNSFYVDDQIFSKETEINKLNNIKMLFYLGALIVISVITLMIVHLFSREVSKDIISIRMNGYNKNQLLIYTVFDSLYRFIPIYMTALIVSLFIQKLINIFTVDIIIFSIIGLLLSVTYQTIVNFIRISKVI